MACWVSLPASWGPQTVEITFSELVHESGVHHEVVPKALQSTKIPITNGTSSIPVTAKSIPVTPKSHHLLIIINTIAYGDTRYARVP
jgi:hypothetical protein